MRKEFNKEQLEALTSNVRNVENVLTKTLDWVYDTSNISEKYGIIKNIKNHRRQVRKLIPRIAEKPAIAFFGASQCGKSHLVKNLLKGNSNEMAVYDNCYKKYINFIKYINPDGGGNEATALVTRFKSFENNLNKNYPVQLELVSVKDLLLILVEGFATLGPIENLELPQTAILNKMFENLKNSRESGENVVLNEDEIFEIKEYLEKYKKKELALLLDHLNKIGFWDVLVQNYYKINTENIAEYLSVLWYSNESVTGLFKQLIETLKDCNFLKIYYAHFNIIFKQKPEEYNALFSDITNILDVNRLNDFKVGITKLVSIFDASNKEIKIKPHLLCAICKEVTLSIFKNPSDGDSLLDKLDLLDFPGSRPGTKFNSTGAIEINILMEILKRGKISYLFNVYSDNFQISNLAIVSSLSRQLDGASLIPHILFPWINTYIGYDAEERYLNLKLNESKLPPLFIILTYLNEILIYNQDKDTLDPKDKLKTAFLTRLKEDLFADYSWRIKWTSHNNITNQFKNFYLLRDFSYCKLYKKEKGLETVVNEEFENYFQNVKNAIVNNSDSQSIFESVIESFDNATNANLDGSELIIANLQELKSNFLKTNSIIQKCRLAIEQISNELGGYKHSDNVSDRIKEVKSQIVYFNTRINRLVADNLNVNYIINKLIVSEQDVYHLVYSMVTNREFGNTQNVSKQFPFILEIPEWKGLKLRAEKLNCLMKYFDKKSESELLEYLNDELDMDAEAILGFNEVQMDSLSLYIAKKVKTYWFENQLNPEKFLSDKKYLNNEFINGLIINLKNNYEKLKISNFIANKIKPYVEGHNDNLDHLVPMLANLISGILNKFITSFGWDFTNPDEKIRLLHTCRSNDIKVLDLYETNKKSNFNKDQVLDLYKYLDNYEKIMNDLSMEDEQNISLNPYVEAFVKWKDFYSLSLVSNIEVTNYDIESNRKLIGILDEYNNQVIEV
ncbi:MAG TPA: virulence factor SrfC family protein [Saprospiraceae bacterium]|nr:virulence factor SrfC family protein [Saprospiraceae bacterium]